MTSTELLAGDFFKNLLQNFPKEENSISERIEPNVKDCKTLNFISNAAISQLKDLKNLLKSSSAKDSAPNDTINTCLIYPKILNVDTLLGKIYSLLGVKSTNEIFANLMDSFKMIYSKDIMKESIVDSNDIPSKKIQLFDLIQELNFFISPSLIYLDSNNEISKQSFDFFINSILDDNKISKNSLESYINIFNIRHLVLDYFIWNKDSIINVVDNGNVVCSQKNIKETKYIFYSSPSMTNNANIEIGGSLNECLSNDWAHDWSDGVINGNIITYTCLKCGKVEHELLADDCNITCDGHVEDVVVLGDMDGNGLLDANDASQILELYKINK